MNNSKILDLKKPAEISADPLTELQRNGARKLIAEAVEAELQELLEQYCAFRNEQEHHLVIRNGYLPERDVQTGIGLVKIKAPKIRDKNSSGIKCDPVFLLPYLRKTKSVEVLSWLYFKGISRKLFRLFWELMPKAFQLQR